MYVYQEKEDIIRIGETKIIDRIDGKGYVLGFAGWVSGSLDAKYVTVRVEIDGPERIYRIDFSPRMVEYLGLVSPNNFGAYRTRYDDANKIYGGAGTPSQPIPFTRRFEIKLIAPSQPIEESSPLPITYKVYYVLVRIVDEIAFRNSLAEILSARKLESMIAPLPTTR